MTVKDFLDLRTLIRIAGHEPGDIQFKLSARIITHPAARALTEAAKKFAPGEKNELLEKNGVKKWRFDLFARTINVEYDPSVIDPAMLDEFFGTADENRARELVEKVSAMFGVTLEG